jgi:hypothetical protein
VEVFDEDQDRSAGVAAADADVVEAAVVAQCDFAAGVDRVMADPVVGGVEGDPGGDGLGSRRVGVGGGVAAQGPMRSLGVVVVAEGVELGLQASDGGGPSLGGEPAFDGLVETLDAPMFVKQLDSPGRSRVTAGARRRLPGRCIASSTG